MNANRVRAANDAHAGRTPQEFERTHVVRTGGRRREGKGISRLDADAVEREREENDPYDDVRTAAAWAAWVAETEEKRNSEEKGKSKEKGKSEALGPAKTSTHRRTRMHGDGRTRDSQEYLDGLSSPQDGSDELSAAYLDNIQWHFCATENPHEGKQYPGFALPIFNAHSQWIDRKGKEAHEDLKFISQWPRVMKSLRRQAVMKGLCRQAQHAAHLARLVKGWILKPWASSWDFWEDDSPIASALLRIYGPNPVPAFLHAMQECGIVPTDPTRIGAGNVLHQFHVVGDRSGTKNGWAILHRCPGAGTFGSRRTGAVYCWHSRPEKMEETRSQFEDDYRRAMEGISERKLAA